MIPASTVERIFEAANILEVVGEFVHLRRRGINYIGLCPFHQEKTPSFNVNPARGIYKCFGCGKGGNSVNFIMEHEQMGYPEALKYLARKYNIAVEEEQPSPEQALEQTQRESLLVAVGFAQKHFEQLLHEHDEGRAVGLSYFVERGFSAETIRKFQLGYALDGYDKFTTHALSQGYQLEVLEKAGLTQVKEGRSYDRFRGRVIFPIHSVAGRTIAFGARVLSREAKAAKYLNSPESDIYHKSQVLYGVHLAKRGIMQHEKCFMVEGYTDVISMHQAGIENVVASSGTSLTTQQIALVKRFTPNITMLYDGDAAGIKASLRGIDLVLEQGMNVRVVLLPDGHDPDSMARDLGAAAFLDYVRDNEQDFVKFKTRLLIDETQGDPITKARLVGDLVRTVAIIPDAVTRSIYLKECAEMLELGEEMLHEQVRQIRHKQYGETVKKEQWRRSANEASAPRQAPPEATPTRQTPAEEPPQTRDGFEKELLRVLLCHGNQTLYNHHDNPQSGLELAQDETVSVAEFIFGFIEAESEMKFRNALYAQVFGMMLEHYERNAALAEEGFVQHPDPRVSALASDLVQDRYFFSKIWTKGDGMANLVKIEPKEGVPKILNRYKHLVVLELIAKVQSELRQAPPERQEELLRRYMQLKEVSMYLAKLHGDRAVIR